MTAVVVAGLGSEYRRDDGVGVEVARRVAASGSAVDIGPMGEPLDLLGAWDGADLAVVVDAVRSGAAPGTVSVIEFDEPGALDEPGVFVEHGAVDEHRVRPGGHGRDGAGPGASTHGIGLVGVLRLARVVGSAPSRVVVVAVEGDDFSPGLGLTPPVAGAVERAAAVVDRLVRAAGTEGDDRSPSDDRPDEDRGRGGEVGCA